MEILIAWQNGKNRKMQSLVFGCDWVPADTRFTDFLFQGFRSVQIVIEIGMIRNAQQRQSTNLCWSIWSMRIWRTIPRRFRCLMLYERITWRLLRCIISGFVEWRCLLVIPPWRRGGPWSGCCWHRRRRSRRRRPRKSSGRRLIGWLTIRRARRW